MTDQITQEQAVLEMLGDKELEAYLQEDDDGFEEKNIDPEDDDFMMWEAIENGE